LECAALIQVNAAPPAVRQSGAFCWRNTVVLTRSEYVPTDDAPLSGGYELLNIFGTPTGEAVSASEGERLPAAPLGYSWRLMAVDEPLEVARRRVLEAERRIARQKLLVEEMERRGNAEIVQGRSLLRALQGSLQAARNYIERLKAFPR
jgi:hypothetical protein